MSDFGNLWNDNADLPAKPVVTDDIDPELLRVNLGQVSQFVGLMDTIDKVREHLAQVAQYQTVQMNIIEAIEDRDHKNEQRKVLEGKVRERKQQRIAERQPVEYEASENAEASLERYADYGSYEFPEEDRPRKDRAPRGRPANPERAEWVARLAAATEDWREAVKRRKDMDDEVRDLRERMRRIEENPPT